MAADPNKLTPRFAQALDRYLSSPEVTRAHR
jgi:hypothetical protein